MFGGVPMYVVGRPPQGIVRGTLMFGGSASPRHCEGTLIFGGVPVYIVGRAPPRLNAPFQRSLRPRASTYGP